MYRALACLLLTGCAVGTYAPPGAVPLVWDFSREVLAVEAGWPGLQLEDVQVGFMTSDEMHEYCGGRPLGCNWSGASSIAVVSTRPDLWPTIITHELEHVACYRMLGNSDKGHTNSGVWSGPSSKWYVALAGYQ